jgi:uncharacterized membrane protein (UPF0127 family)
VKSLVLPVIALAAALLWTGCGPRAEVPLAQPANPLEPVRAQPRLPTIKLFLDQQKLTAEIARAPQEIVAGMMFRTNLPPDEAMLFVFADTDRRAFWMKNCLVPLSIAFLDPEGVIREIQDRQPGDTNSVPTDSRRIQFVLEVNQGWFQQHALRVGTVVRTERGTLRESFFPYQAVPAPR